MKGTGSAREALIAETLGEIAALLDRMEAVAPALEASRLALVNASVELSDQITAFESRMAAITENAKVVAIRHVARRTDELARSAGEAQVRALRSAATDILRDELRPALQRLAALHPVPPRRGGFANAMTHMAVAVLSSALGGATAAWLCAR